MKQEHFFISRFSTEAAARFVAGVNRSLDKAVWPTATEDEIRHLDDLKARGAFIQTKPSSTHWLSKRKKG